MNVFYLDKDPQRCAQYHCDQHCVKMIIEYAQILSTTHRVLDGEAIIIRNDKGHKQHYWKINGAREHLLYRPGFYNHPCVLWCETSSGNYKYLYELFCALCDEFKKRYGKTHLTDTKLRKALKNLPNNIPEGKLTKPALAMPDDCKTSDAVTSYRNYYNMYKSEFAKWHNEPPKWFKPLRNKS